MWTLAHQLQRIGRGKGLRVVTGRAGTIHWSVDGWATANELEMRDSGFGCWFGDLPSDRLDTGAHVVVTFRWQEEWEGQDFRVEIDPPEYGGWKSGRWVRTDCAIGARSASRHAHGIL